MTKKELLSIPKRKWDEVLHDVNAIYFIPSKRIHDSGYICFDLIAVKGKNHEEYIGFGGGCDAVKISGDVDICFDCEKDNGCIRLWSRRPFSVSVDCSTIELY